MRTTAATGVENLRPDGAAFLLPPAQAVRGPVETYERTGIDRHCCQARSDN